MFIALIVETGEMALRTHFARGSLGQYAEIGELRCAIATMMRLAEQLRRAETDH